MTTVTTRSRVQLPPTSVFHLTLVRHLLQDTSSARSQTHFQSLLCRFDACCGTWRRGPRAAHAMPSQILLGCLQYNCSHELLCTDMCALQGSTLTRGADLALALVLPVHSHVAMNNVISDYVPKNVAGKLHHGVGTVAGLAQLPEDSACLRTTLELVSRELD